MKNKAKLLFPLFTAFIIALSILGPERFSTYQDRRILDEIHQQPVMAAGQGYRYALTSQEKLYLLSQALNTQGLPESGAGPGGGAGGQGGSAQMNPVPGYPPLNGNYAFVLNHNNPYDKEFSDEEVFHICNRELAELKRLGILPESVMEMEEAVYDAVLYSAIDVLEPRSNVAVWKLSLANIQRNVNKQNRVIDICMDAENGKIYEFYARTEAEWEDMDADGMIRQWSRYQELEVPVPYEIDNPLLETTPFFNKYRLAGESGEETIITVGFYEGINEMFLKLSR